MTIRKIIIFQICQLTHLCTIYMCLFIVKNHHQFHRLKSVLRPEYQYYLLSVCLSPFGDRKQVSAPTNQKTEITSLLQYGRYKH